MQSLAAQLDRAGGFAPRTVLVLDEAGMAPTLLSAQLLVDVERAGVKVIAVGDPGQLGSVEAGGWLAALARQQPTVRLSEVIRQGDPAERDALEALRDGDPERHLAHKHDAITVHAAETGALQTLVEQWHAAERERAAPRRAQPCFRRRGRQPRACQRPLRRARLHMQCDRSRRCVALMRHDQSGSARGGYCA